MTRKAESLAYKVINFICKEMGDQLVSYRFIENSGLPAVYLMFPEELPKDLLLEIIRLSCILVLPRYIRKHGVLIEDKTARDGGLEIRFATNRSERETIKGIPGSKPYDLLPKERRVPWL